jgi:hypothetical protein
VIVTPNVLAMSVPIGRAEMNGSLNPIRPFDEDHSCMDKTEARLRRMATAAHASVPSAWFFARVPPFSRHPINLRHYQSLREAMGLSNVHPGS